MHYENVEVMELVLLPKTIINSNNINYTVTIDSAGPTLYASSSLSCGGGSVGPTGLNTRSRRRPDEGWP